MNFGESKGLNFDRVLIFPHGLGKRWLHTGDCRHIKGSRAKLYVGITRARYSVAFVLDGSAAIPNAQFYQPAEFVLTPPPSEETSAIENGGSPAASEGLRSRSTTDFAASANAPFGPTPSSRGAFRRRGRRLRRAGGGGW
jgi:hypothetical protein